jgi:hypothetical protein
MYPNPIPFEADILNEVKDPCIRLCSFCRRKVHPSWICSRVNSKMDVPNPIPFEAVILNEVKDGAFKFQVQQSS